MDIRKIVRSINLESKRIQKDFGVSIPQLLCLDYLYKTDKERSTHRELTRYLNLNSSTVTGIINRLEKKGYLQRLPKQGDRRVTFVALTEAGRHVAEGTPGLLHEKLNAGLANLPEQKIEAIRESLQLLTNALGITKLDASPLLTMEDPIGPSQP